MKIYKLSELGPPPATYCYCHNCEEIFEDDTLIHSPKCPRCGKGMKWGFNSILEIQDYVTITNYKFHLIDIPLKNKK